MNGMKETSSEYALTDSERKPSEIDEAINSINKEIVFAVESITILEKSLLPFMVQKNIPTEGMTAAKQESRPLSPLMAFLEETASKIRSQSLRIQNIQHRVQV